MRVREREREGENLSVINLQKMLCRKVTRPVLKTSKLWLDVLIVSHFQFVRRMDDIKIRRASTEPAPPRTSDSSMELHKNGYINRSESPHNAKVLFEDLVFYPKGRAGVKDQDENSIAQENAKYNVSIKYLIFANSTILKQSIQS